MKEVLQYLNIAAVFIGFAVYAYLANKWENRHQGTPRKGGGHFYGESPTYTDLLNLQNLALGIHRLKT